MLIDFGGCRGVFLGCLNWESQRLERLASFRLLDARTGHVILGCRSATCMTRLLRGNQQQRPARHGGLAPKGRWWREQLPEFLLLSP